MHSKNRNIERLEYPVATKALYKVQAHSVFSAFSYTLKNYAGLFRFVFLSMVLSVGILLGGSYMVWGQTVLLSPTGDGGFENGTSFGANGWTTVNAATNYWVVGTATSFAGTRSAYVSNNGAANQYDNGN